MNFKSFNIFTNILFTACLGVFSSTAAVADVAFSKAFKPGTIDYGQRSTLTFTVDNGGGDFALNDLAFTDPLPPGVIIADPPNSFVGCTGGVLTAEAGTGVITYAPLYPGDASVPAGGNCSISVDIVGNAAGTHQNVTGDLYSDLESVAPPATADLVVNPPGTVWLVKSFEDDPVPPGGEVTLAFTLANNDRSEIATDIEFTDDLNSVLPGLAIAAPLPTAPCGSGSVLNEVSSTLVLSGGNLAPGASCSFSVLLGVSIKSAPGIYDNITSSVSAMLAGSPIKSAPATDSLFVAPVPLFTKSFSEDLVAPGTSLTLNFNITNSSPTSGAWDIGFVDPIGAIFPGITPPDTLPTNPCGRSSTLQFIPGGSFEPAQIILTDGNLPAGTTCSFDINLTIPDATPTGTYVNITDPITAVVDETQVVGPPAVDDLGIVAAPKLQKSFEKQSAEPGELVNLSFTLTHAAEAPADANGIGFTDNLGAMLNGAVAEGLPINNACGTGSTVTGTDEITMKGAKLVPGESCSFDVAVRIPAGAPSGSYVNETSIVTANVGGLQVLSNPATAPLNVATLVLEKNFVDNPVAAGTTASLEFTLTNSSPLEVTGIYFTDDLNAMNGSFTANGLPANGVCGIGSSMVETNNILTLKGGILPAGGSCTWSIDVTVPIDTVPNKYSNATSEVAADGGITGPAARDVLEVIEPMAFTKSFGSNAQVAAGASVQLDFSITNLSSESISDINFTDDLDAMVSGATVVTSAQTDICGLGSTLSGQTTKLAFEDGALAPGASCTFRVAVSIPANSVPGDYLNLTSNITSNVGAHSLTGNPADAELRVLEAPLFSKEFKPASILLGELSTLILTIDNSLSTVAASNISLRDQLPAGMAIASEPYAKTDCEQGTLSAPPGSRLISYLGGAVAANSACTVQVDVVGLMVGEHLNTTDDLTSSSGNSGKALATLAVDALGTICFPGPDEYVIPAGIIFSSAETTEISAEGGIVSDGELFIDSPHSLILRAPFVDFAPLLQVQDGAPGAQLRVISEPVICNGGAYN